MSICRHELGWFTPDNSNPVHYFHNFIVTGSQQPGSGFVKYVWYHLIPLPRKPNVRHKDLDNTCHTSRDIANFVWNFVAMATRVGRRVIFWHHSIAWPRKLPVIRKDHLDISHTSQVIADFFTKIVAVATGVSCSRICLTSFSSPTPNMEYPY